MKPFSLRALVFFWLVSFSTLVEASDFSALTDPGRIGQDLSEHPADLRNKDIPAPVMPTEPPTQAQPNSSTQRISFIFRKAIFAGNTVLPDSTLQAVFNDFIDRPMNIHRLYTCVDTITQLYQKKGYVLSKALLPPQKIKEGVVHIQIIEGFISHVQIEGLQGQNQAFIQQYEKSILALRPLEIKKLEHTLLLLNDLPGFSIQSFIQADPNTPLGSTLVLKAHYKPFSGAVSVDNYQSPFLGPVEYAAQASAHSWLLPGGSSSLRFLAGEQWQRLRYYQMGHTQALGRHGLMLRAEAYQTLIHPGFTVRALENYGYSQSAHLHLSYPLIRSRTESWRVSTQYEYISSRSEAMHEDLYHDRLHLVDITSHYEQKKDDLRQDLKLSLTQGLPFQQGKSPQRLLSRAGGQSVFTKIHGHLAYHYYFSDHWSLYSLLSAQYAFQPVLNTELFSFGGAYLGRGYSLSQFTADSGVAGTLEAQWQGRDAFILKNPQYFAFIDHGIIWSRLADSSLEHSGLSAGLGWRALMAGCHLDIFIAKPLSKANATAVLAGRSGYGFVSGLQIKKGF